MSRRTWEKRAWLNRPGFLGAAYVLARVELTDGPDGFVTVADCNRAVTLELDADDHASAANTFRKLDTLIEVLQRTREELAAARTERVVDAVSEQVAAGPARRSSQPDSLWERRRWLGSRGGARVLASVRGGGDAQAEFTLAGDTGGVTLRWFVATAADRRRAVRRLDVIASVLADLRQELNDVDANPER